MAIIRSISISCFGPTPDCSPGCRPRTAFGPTPDCRTHGDYTSSFGGTSSATPLAAGLAALILSVNPELTSAEVKALMMETADKIDQENGQYENGHSPLYGHGRINAHRAVAAAAGDNPDNRLPEVLLMEHRINKPISDLNEVQDPIVFPLAVQIKSIEVGVDIRHTWRSDLRVILLDNAFRFSAAESKP